jgi:hypothetical protein
MLAPLRGPLFIGHDLPHVSEAHGIWVPVAEAEVEMVVVNPVTEHPTVVTVVEGVQVVVGRVELPVTKEVGTHLKVTLNAVDESVHEEEDEVVDESELELLSVLSSLSFSVRLSLFCVSSSSVSSMESTFFVMMSSVTFCRSSSMHTNELMISPMAPNNPLFFFEPHPEEEDEPPRSEISPSTSLRMPFTLFNVSVLRGSGFFFQELMIGIRPAISEDTEDTLDVASELWIVDVTGGRVIGVEYESPVMTGTDTVLPDSIIVENTMVGRSELAFDGDRLLLLPLLEGGVVDETPMLVLVLTVGEALADEESVLLLLRTELLELPVLEGWFVRDKEDPGIPLRLLKDGLPVLEDGVAVDVEDGVL